MSNVKIAILSTNNGDLTAVRVEVDGNLLGTGYFGGEPEDNSEDRKYSWVKGLLTKLSLKLGADVQVVHHEWTDPEDWEDAVESKTPLPELG